MALVLLFTPTSAQSYLASIPKPKPIGQSLAYGPHPISFIPTPTPRPDYDREVLAPLRKAQAELAQQTADCKARGGHLEAKTCVVPPPPPVGTSAPTVAPVASYAVGSLQAIIIAAANSHGVSAEMMLRIAKCESTFNPNARNSNYTAIVNGVSYGNPVGMFQHVEGYWAARAVKYGYPGASVFDPVANANVTAAMMAAEGTSAWECW